MIVAFVRAKYTPDLKKNSESKFLKKKNTAQASRCHCEQKMYFKIP